MSNVHGPKNAGPARPATSYDDVTYDVGITAVHC